MGNTERVDKFGKSSSDEDIEAKNFSKKRLEKVKTVGHCTARNSQNRKAEHNVSHKNENAAVHLGNEVEKIFTLTDNTSTKETMEANTTERNLYPVDSNLSEWQQVKPKGRRKSRKNTSMPRYMKRNENENMRQTQRQDTLKYSERRTANFSESNSQQRILNNASGIKSKSVTQSKNNYSNIIANTYNNTKNDSQTVNQMSHERLNKSDKKHIAERNKHLNGSVVKTLRESVKEIKQAKKSEDLNLSSEVPVQHLVVNSNRHFKNTGTVPKRSQATQTFKQVKDKALDSAISKDQNLNNETKEYELKQVKFTKVSKFKRTDLANQMPQNKSYEMSLNKVINQREMNEYLETARTNQKHYSPIEENTTNLDRKIHRKANPNVGKLDHNIYQHDCCSDLTEESETLRRNVGRLDNKNNTNGLYQHIACTSLMKEYELKHMKVTKVLKPKRSDLVNQISPNKPCEKWLDAINQNELNECLETAPTNPKHHSQIEENKTNLKGDILQKAKAYPNVEKLDHNIYHHGCSSDLSGKNEIIRNGERLDDTNNANGVYQRIARTSLTNENTVGRDLESPNDTIGHIEYEYETLGRELESPNETSGYIEYEYETVGRELESLNETIGHIEYEYETVGRELESPNETIGHIEYEHEKVGRELESPIETIGHIEYEHETLERELESPNEIIGHIEYEYETVGRELENPNETIGHIENEYTIVGRDLESTNYISGPIQYEKYAPHLFPCFPYWPTFVLPFQQNFANYMFQPQLDGCLASEIPDEHFDNGAASYGVYLNRFSNATNYDGSQRNEHIVNEKDSENATNTSQNLVTFSSPNIQLRCMQHQQFVLEYTFNGEKYYHTLYHSAPQLI